MTVDRPPYCRCLGPNSNRPPAPGRPNGLATKDKSNVLIQSGNYGDGSGSCVVRWIVETAGSRGTNYAVHALCTSASQPDKTQVVNIVIRPQSDGRAVMGRGFDNLKTYLRCPGR